MRETHAIRLYSAARNIKRETHAVRLYLELGWLLRRRTAVRLSTKDAAPPLPYWDTACSRQTLRTL
jgi:hypothetical protein